MLLIAFNIMLFYKKVYYGNHSASMARKFLAEECSFQFTFEDYRLTIKTSTHSLSATFFLILLMNTIVADSTHSSSYEFLV